MIRKALLFIYFLVLLLATTATECLSEKITGFGVLDPNRKISYIGTFSNMRYTEEHAYGYKIKLWNDNGDMIGFFMASAGLAGDTPTGYFKLVSYEPKSKEISFSSKLTGGTTSDRQGNFVPSRDFYVFSGKLSDKALSGYIVHVHMLEHDNPDYNSEPVVLNKIDSDNYDIHTYKEWVDFWNSIESFRGPKW